MNDYRINRDRTFILTDKQRKSIENRQKTALLYNAREKIEDYQSEVFDIIDNDGLKNDNDRDRLSTALKILPYITPIKKQVEMQIITRKIEDLIHEDIEDAEIIDKAAQNGESANNG